MWRGDSLLDNARNTRGQQYRNSVFYVRGRTYVENTIPVLLAACVLRALSSNGSTPHNIFLSYTNYI
jgi:hypothetical protein